MVRRSTRLTLMRRFPYPKRTILGGVLATVAGVRWILSLFADLNDAGEGFSRTVGAMRLPSLGFLDSPWFLLSVVVVGLLLVWSGQMLPSQVTARQKFEHRLDILDQKLRMSLFYGYRLLGELQDNILREGLFPDAEYDWRRDLHAFRHGYVLFQERYQTLIKLPFNRDSVSQVDALLKEGYMVFIELDSLVSRIRPLPEAQRFEWAVSHQLYTETISGV